MTAIHVCHLVHHLALGGLQNQLLRIVEASHESVAYTICYVAEDDSLRADFEATGAEVVRLETPGTGPASQFTPRNVWRLTRYLRRGEFDVLHCHTSLYLHLLGRVCGQAADVPVVGTYHNTSENFNPAVRVLERATRPASEVNVAVSKGVERSFARDACLYSRDRSDLTRRTYTIRNGIDVDAFRSTVDEADREMVRTDRDVDDEVVYLTIGRYSPEKNQHLLLRAMADVLRDVDAHLFVVGWGDLEDDLRRTAGDLGIAGDVTITGRVPTVHEYYAMADAFVLPSATEGLSVVLLEAMSAGLPIVATDVAGTDEAVDDGTTGYVVSPGSRRELAAAMTRLGDAERRRRLGSNGYERAREEFSVHETARSYVDIYRRVARSSTVRRSRTMSS